MWHDHQAVLPVYEIDRLLQRKSRRHLLSEVEADEMALQRVELLADDDLDAQVQPRGCLMSGESAADGVVIGDGDDIEACAGRAGQHLLNAEVGVPTVGRVYVKIC